MRGLGWLLMVGCTAGPVGQALEDGTTRSVPVYGGTMAGHESGLVVVADPLRDVVVFDGKATVEVPQPKGSEPFRVQVTDERVFVSMRGRGEVVAFDHEGQERARAGACPEPRGLAHEDGVLVVACAGGEVVLFDDQSLARIAEHRFRSDLRDVVIDGDMLYVSRFRDASVLRIEWPSMELESVARPEGFLASARVAWRMVRHPSGGALLLHQLHSDEPIGIDEDDPERVDGPPYGGGRCTGPLEEDEEPTSTKLVTSHLTRVQPRFTPRTGGVLVGVAVPVDVAVEPDGRTYHVAALSNRAGRSAVATWDADLAEFGSCPEAAVTSSGVSGLVTGVAFAGDERVDYDRAGGRLRRDRGLVMVGSEIVEGPGSRLFHEDSGLGLLCTSCHAEGQDDGHTWDFGDRGMRRTQNLSGGLTTRQSFHWDAEFGTFQALVDDTFTERMGGRAVPLAEVVALGEWLDEIEPVRSSAPAESDEVERGQTLFERPDVGCVACHRGPALSDHQLHQVATDGPLRKTPPLVGLGSRAPYMSDGCAPTVLARLTDVACGGDRHGTLDGLSQAELEAMAAFLSTL